MKNFLIVTDRDKNFSGFLAALNARTELKIRLADSVESALQALTESVPDLVITDEAVDGISGLDIARAVIQKNAMVHLAVVSSLSPEEFHEEGEGLGIMAHLPPGPGNHEAEILLETLEKMS
jgi:DNA-binding NtrC family response regulator